MAAEGTEEKPPETSHHLECPICLDTFTKPKILPCQHTVCEACLSSFIESTRLDNGGTLLSFPCPVCRVTVVPADPKVSTDKWANALPANQFVQSFLVTNVDIGQLCNACEAMKKSEVATSWCKQCSGALCDWCKEYHKAFDLHSTHDVISLVELKTRPTSFLSDDDICIQHKEPFKVYCMDHRVMCCAICLVAAQHRQCRDLQTLEEVARNVDETGNGIEGVMKFIDSLQSDMLKLLKLKKENIVQLQQKRDDIMQHIDSQVTQTKEKLYTFRSEVNDRVKASCKEKMIKLEDTVTYIQRFIKDVETCLGTLRSIDSQGTQVQKFVSTEKIKLRLRNHFKQLVQDIDPEKNVDIKLDVDKHFCQIQLQLEEKLDIEMIESIPDRTVGQCDVAKLHPGPPRVQYWTQTPELCFTQTLTTDGDGTCWSYGGSFMKNGSLVIADTGNDKAKLYSAFGEFVSHYDVEYPVDICQGPEEDIVFVSSTSPKESVKGEILNINFSRTPKHEQTFDVNTDLWGITKYGYFLAVPNLSSIQLVDTRCGKSIPWVTKPAAATDSLIYVEISNKTGYIYYTDGYALTCLNGKGEIVFKYKTEHLQKPVGVALDHEDNVYFCDGESGTVHQVSSDGSKSRILLTDLGDLTQPSSIGFHPDGKRFFVTSLGDNEPFAVYSFP